LVLGKVLGITKGSYTTRNNGNLEQRISVLQVPSSDSVARLVVSDGLLFFW
jgi:hypothetical protein